MMVIKRDGTKIPFNKEKIINAINKAFIEVDGQLYETDTAKDIANDLASAGNPNRTATVTAQSGGQSGGTVYAKLYVNGSHVATTDYAGASGPTSKTYTVKMGDKVYATGITTYSHITGTVTLTISKGSDCYLDGI